MPIGRPGPLTILAALLLLSVPEAAASPWPGKASRAAEELTKQPAAQRLRAVRALADSPPALARAGILMALGDEDARVRTAAARVALAHGYSGLDDVIEPWISSRTPSERILGLRLLSREMDANDVKTIASLLTDPDRQVRTQAVTALGKTPHRHAALASDLLLSGLDDPEPRVRRAVVHSLGRLGQSDSALPLAGHINDPEAEVRAEIAVALGALGQASVAPALVASLGDSDEGVIIAAVRSLSLLGFDAAVFSMRALLERPYVDGVVRETIFALARLGTQEALAALMSKAHQPAFRVHLLPALSGRKASEVVGLEACLRESAGDTLEGCAQLWVGLDGAAEPILEAVDSGRLGVGRALLVLFDDESLDAIVLALEALRSPRDSERRAALSFLGARTSLPEQTRAALVQAVRDAPDGQERAVLLQVLSRVEGLDKIANGSDDLSCGTLSEEFLGSNDDAVARAAAALCVSRGKSGEKLAVLLSGRRVAWAKGALERLAQGMNRGQAQTIVSLLGDPTFGRRTQLLDILWALPDDIDQDAQRALLREFREAHGKDRDSLLDALARFEIAKSLQWRTLNRADRLKLVQMAALHPEGKKWARAALDDVDPRVASLAVEQMGLLGSSQELLDAYQVIEDRQSKPNYLRASALRALALGIERGEKLELPASALSSAHCSSPHLATSLASLHLALVSGQDCPSVSLLDVLMNDERARARLFLARLLARHDKLRPELAAALERCAIYEVREEIAAACDSRFSPANSSPPARIARMRLRVRPAWLRDEAPLYPILLLVDGQVRAAVADRRGMVLLPRAQVDVLDAALAF